jgi:hypothetical protein
MNADLLPLSVDGRLGINALPIVAALEKRATVLAAGQVFDVGNGIAGDDVQRMAAQLRVRLKANIMFRLIDRTVDRELEIGA